MDTTDFLDAVDEYLASERSELFEFTERLGGFDTQNLPGGTTGGVESLESNLGRFLDDHDGYPSIRSLVGDDYAIITF